jgi:hypothetical protein
MRAEKTREARNISFAELDTALAEASYLVNCRPMMRKLLMRRIQMKSRVCLK